MKNSLTELPIKKLTAHGSGSRITVTVYQQDERKPPGLTFKRAVAIGEDEGVRWEDRSSWTLSDTLLLRSLIDVALAEYFKRMSQKRIREELTELTDDPEIWESELEKIERRMKKQMQAKSDPLVRPEDL